MTDRQTTHAPGCWSWGPRHYECALREIERLAARLTAAQPAISGYTCTVPDDCETLHWRGQILSMNELASVAQPAEGEEIMVNTPYDVFILPLQPSGLSSGPRFVVHVPGPEQPAAVDGAKETDLWRCTVCGRVGTVGRCCGEETRERANMEQLLAENERLRDEVERLRTDGASAVRWAPGSAYWSEVLRDLFGPDARKGIDVLERRWQAALERADKLAEALEEIRSRTCINEAMNPDPFALTAMLGDIHHIADAALPNGDGEMNDFTSGAHECFCDRRYKDANRLETCGDCPRDYIAGAWDARRKYIEEHSQND